MKMMLLISGPFVLKTLILSSSIGISLARSSSDLVHSVPSSSGSKYVPDLDKSDFSTAERSAASKSEDVRNSRKLKAKAPSSFRTSDEQTMQDRIQSQTLAELLGMHDVFQSNKMGSPSMKDTSIHQLDPASRIASIQHLGSPLHSREQFTQLRNKRSSLSSKNQRLLKDGGNDPGKNKFNKLPSLIEPHISEQASKGGVLGRALPDSAFFRPLLLPSVVQRRDSEFTLEYPVLELLALDSGKDGDPHRIFRYSYDASQNDGQTWWIHRALHLEQLPTGCLDTSTMRPVLAFSQALQRAYLFAFGIHPNCSLLQSWKLGEDHFDIVNALGSEKVPRQFQSLLAVDSNVTNSTDVLVFGGRSKCDRYSVSSRLCSDGWAYSDQVWRLRLLHNATKDEQELPVWQCLYPGLLANAHQRAVAIPPSRLSPLVTAINETFVLMHGGITRHDTGYAPICDLWSFDIATGHWTALPEPTTLCARRWCVNNTMCAPLRPLGSYDVHQQRLIVVRERIAIIAGFSAILEGLDVWVYDVKLQCWTFQGSTVHTGQTVARLSFTATVGDLPQREVIVHDGRVLLTDVQDMQTEELLFSVLPACPNSSGNTTSTRDAAVAILPLTAREDKIFQFGAAIRCLSPAPVLAAFDAEKPGGSVATEALVFLGGVCYSTNRDDWQSRVPLHSTLPIWFYLPGMDGYLKKSIHQHGPVPSFPLLIMQSAVKLFSSNISKAVMMGGMSPTGPLQDGTPSGVWCFDLHRYYWQKAVIENMHEAPVVDEGMVLGQSVHSVAEADMPILVAYGGGAADLRHTPLSGITAMATANISALIFSNLSACHCRWQRLSAGRRGLPKNFGHAVTVTPSNEVYVYSGIPNILARKVAHECGHFFRLHLRGLGTDKATASCTAIHSTTSSPALPLTIWHTISVLSEHAFLLLGGIEIQSSANCYESDTCTAYFLQFTGSDRRSVDVIPFFRHSPVSFHQIYKDYLFGGYSGSGIDLLQTLKDIPVSYKGYMAVASTYIGRLRVHHTCPAGLGNGGNETERCTPCANNFYSDSTSDICQPCPAFQLTNFTDNQESCYVQNPCAKDHCHRGQCRVVNGSAVCSCPVGYVAYDNCQLPLIFIAAGCGAALVFLVVLLLTIHACMKRKKESEMKDRELQAMVERLSKIEKLLRELARSRIIQRHELTLLRRLAKTETCFIWLAKIFDTKVVVKLLRYTKMAAGRKEQFYVEAEELRRVRHQNVVMFLGAGTDPKTSQPFLVLEHARRGSLHDILQNPSIGVTPDDSLRFALQAALGMKFLHGLEPARVHCNLKTPNLLVTEKWVVKVADFGMMCLLSRVEELDAESSQNHTKVDAAPGALFASEEEEEESGENRPLLKAPSIQRERQQPGSGRGVGRYVESAWSAPETLSERKFNCATDVYSFGIVLWEIFSRQIPFQDTKDFCEIRDRVIAGHRPDLPVRMPYAYRTLVEKCWHEEALERPTFETTVTVLEAMIREKSLMEY
ncbi:uncharacterized protein LOC135818160 [Sycon ciliatum]|uniref:uncharacterized protein LOC135818160 n=1 Tax=Sycon ciliatum TaxID=27933 RepID=UPI0031F6CD80